jgi:hypothetical protein
MSQQIKNTSAKLFRAIIVLCIVVIIGALEKIPVKAQMAAMYGSYNYRDAWGDGDTTIYGYGSTEAYANSYNHKSRVVISLTSPSGMVASYDTGFPSGYASAMVSLPFDEDNLGDYFLDVRHRNYCPVTAMEFANAITTATVRTGISQVCKTLSDTVVHGPGDLTCNYWYNVAPCDVKCNGLDFSERMPVVTCPNTVLVYWKWTERTDNCGVCSTTCRYWKRNFISCSSCSQLSAP